MFLFNREAYSDSMAIEAAKYLIQLYASTEYHCTRQKLQKLIIFAHLACLIDGQQGLLGTESLTATTLGLGIESVSVCFDNINFNGINRIQAISSVKKLPESVFAQQYHCDTYKLGTAVFILEEMFKAFGAYPSELLSAITRKMPIYPKETDFSCYPRYMKAIEDTDILRYVLTLRRQYSADVDGTHIICKEVSKYAQELAKVYADNLYV